MKCLCCGMPVEEKKPCPVCSFAAEGEDAAQQAEEHRRRCLSDEVIELTVYRFEVEKGRSVERERRYIRLAEAEKLKGSVPRLHGKAFAPVVAQGDVTLEIRLTRGEKRKTIPLTMHFPQPTPLKRIGVMGEAGFCFRVMAGEPGRYVCSERLSLLMQ